MNTTAADWIDQYHTLQSRGGWTRAARTQIELLGDDSPAFLNNYCTANILGLKEGQGTEAFITSLQGKTLAHVLAFRTQSGLILDTEPGQADVLIPHLDRYILREDVRLEDRSRQWAEVWVIGAQAAHRLGPLDEPWPERPWEHAKRQLGPIELWVRRLDMLDLPHWALVVLADESGGTEDADGKKLTESEVPSADRAIRDSRPGMAQRLTAWCIERLGGELDGRVWEALRVEAGFPRFGRDVTEANLPQEVGRDRQAISFTKGCYLGQETVARIDAVGHVNRKLAGLRWDGPIPPPEGTELVWQGKPVGQVTSAVYSPRAQSAIGLGYVRRECNAPGTRLESTAGVTEILPLPWGTDR